MLLAILGIGLTSGGVATQATVMALGITVAWGAISVDYLARNSRKQGKPIIAIPTAASGDWRMRLATQHDETRSRPRPVSLSVVVGRT